MPDVTFSWLFQHFKYGLRLIDLPGLTRTCEGSMEIAKKYIQPGHTFRVQKLNTLGPPRKKGRTRFANRFIRIRETGSPIRGLSSLILES